MSSELSLRPRIVSALAAKKLPRWALFTLILLYAIPGLFGRDPWRSQDLIGIGIADSLLQAPHWQVHLYGDPITEIGPLYYALAGLLIRALPFLPADESARLTTALLLILAFAALWWSAFHQALDRHALPSDDLGLSPKPLDWARALADCALLFSMAAVGLVLRVHETTYHVLEYAGTCFALYALERMPRRPNGSALLMGAITGLSVWSINLAYAVGLSLAMITLTVFAQPYRWIARKTLPRWLIGTALALVPWLLGSWHADADWTAKWWQAQVDGLVPTWADPGQAISEGIWVSWPLWPAAIWTLWAHRRDLRDHPYLSAPIALWLTFSLLALSSPRPDENDWLATLAPLAILAAFALPSLKRSVSHLIDWFAVIVFTTISVTIWLYWLAYEAGWPERLATRIAKLFPEMQAHTDWAQVFLGVVVTLAWWYLIVWRSRHNAPRIWRPVILSAAGLALNWALLNTLWLPAGDAQRSYRAVVQSANAVYASSWKTYLETLKHQEDVHALAQWHQDREGAKPCVQTIALGQHQRAAFGFHGAWNLRPSNDTTACPYLLIQDSPGFDLSLPAPRDARLIWEGRRMTDRHERERFRLFLRTAH